MVVLLPFLSSASPVSLSCQALVMPCVQEDKLEPSEQLGDLLRSAGDADAALRCYRSSGATTKVIEGKFYTDYTQPYIAESDSASN